MPRRYVTVDVFTAHRFGGNPLAVVLEADGLSTPQMQAIAAEFNYSETTFVLPPQQSAHTAQVRIFTPKSELPFAGHPNVGTAMVLAWELEAAGHTPAERFVFEEAAGLVPIGLLRRDGVLAAAELSAPAPLSIGASLSAEEAAACLSLPPTDVATGVHRPVVVSVGLPFLVVNLASREALRRSRADPGAHERVLPRVGTDAVFAWVQGAAAEVLHARMFAPLGGVPEDPATGSATAAAIALLTAVRAPSELQLSWRIEQGVEMGRPSLLLGRTVKQDGTVSAVYVSGGAVRVMQGSLAL